MMSKPQVDNQLLQVNLNNQSVYARQGSMVAYTGQIDFRFKSAGVKRLFKGGVTGEGIQLMEVVGSGAVYFADAGDFVQIVHLSDEVLTVKNNHVLAFSDGLSWDIKRIRSRGIVSGGLFSVMFRGTGWVAIVSDGMPKVFPATPPIHVDTGAIIGWKGELKTDFKYTFKPGGLIGRGSGEALQLVFSGQGEVIIQPSEGTRMPSENGGGIIDSVLRLLPF